MTRPIVTAEWLNTHLDDPDLVVLDASQSTSAGGLTTAFEDVRITSARPFDFKADFSKKDTSLPNMLPNPEAFEHGCQQLGINASSKLVVYGNLGIYSSPRVWWMFKVMGHEEIAVLDGGLPAWAEKGFPTEKTRTESYEQGDFQAHFKPDQVKDFQFIKNNIQTGKHLLIDARSAGRFNGLAPEPRKGLRSGHIEHSINIPYTAVLENGFFKSNGELSALLQSAGIIDQPLVFSCGSGVTACIVLLASKLVLKNQNGIYDGSWTEWALKTE